jgi:hypothetical protein
MQTASGFLVTTYTTTSTSYHYWQIVTTSTNLFTTTLSTLTQRTIDGPYLNIEGVFEYETPMFRITIKNIFNTYVDRGKIVFIVSNLAETISDEVTVYFGRVPVGATIYIDPAVSVSHTYHRGDVKVTPINVEIICQGIVTQVPVATYTFTNMHTSTVEYVYTLSRASFYPESIPTLLTVVLSISVGIVSFFLLRMKKVVSAPKPQPTYPPKPVESKKVDDQAAYARYLEKLGELRAQGRISEEVYERLKKRYEPEMRN